MHVLPLNDLIEHYENRECPCNPRLELVPESDTMLVIHDALDGRE